MRVFTARTLAILSVAAVSLVAGSAHALANGQATSICRPGQVGLTVHWADAQDAMFCVVADGLQGMPTSPTIVGLVVRGSDDALSTIDVAPAPSVDIASDASVTSSRSISSSSSTTCINGHCTTITNQQICSDGNCSSQP